MAAPLSMLIVDDDSNIRASWSGYFREMGWDVALAENEDQALDVFVPGAFAVALIDLCLPRSRRAGGDFGSPYEPGLQILEGLRHRDAEICLLPITAFPTTESMNRSAMLGADGFLAKPVDPDIIDAHLRRALSRIDRLRQMYAAPPAQSAEPEPPSLHLLIADDEEHVRGAWKGYFEAHGCLVDTAKDEAQAIEKFDPEKVDVALVDLVLQPGSGTPPAFGDRIFTSGVRVVRAIRRIDPFVGIVVNTAFGAHEHVNLMSTAGADLFIHKPIAPDWARAVVERLGCRVARIRRGQRDLKGWP